MWLLDGITTVPNIEPRAVHDLTLDSREVRAGSLFFALPGRTVHGLKFAAEAAARGASVVLWEPSAEVEVPKFPATVFAATGFVVAFAFVVAPKTGYVQKVAERVLPDV